MDKETVNGIAHLARLSLSDDEATAIAQQLSSILNHFEEISKIDTSGVEPLITPTELTLRLREDRAENLYSPERILQNAPERSGNLFKVPPVV